MSAEGSYDAIIVGAGPGGSAAAAILAQNGRRVLLLEKDRFPRPKVCGEFLSSNARDSLDRLGVRERVEGLAEPIRWGAVHLPRTDAVDFRLPKPAWGISRFYLDHLLASRAAELGAQCRFAARVTQIEGALNRGFRVTFVSGPREEAAGSRVVIGAWGRWDALDRALERGFAARRERFFGWSRDYEPHPKLEGGVRLYAFPGGYCGLSRVEGGRINLAGVIAERCRRRLSAGWESVIAHARNANQDLHRELSGLREGPIGFLGTGPVFFTSKPPVDGGIPMVGDAAGVIDAFSGQGQSAALSSGILAADTFDRGLSGEVSLSDAGDLYAAAWRRGFGRRLCWSAAFRRLMLNPRTGAVVARLAGKRVVRFAISRLSSRA